MNFQVSMLNFIAHTVSSGFPRWQCVLRNECLYLEMLFLPFLFLEVNLAVECNTRLEFRNAFRGKVELEENHDNCVS